MLNSFLHDHVHKKLELVAILSNGLDGVTTAGLSELSPQSICLSAPYSPDLS